MEILSLRVCMCMCVRACVRGACSRLISQVVQIYSFVCPDLRRFSRGGCRHAILLIQLQRFLGAAQVPEGTRLLFFAPVLRILVDRRATKPSHSKGLTRGTMWKTASASPPSGGDDPPRGGSVTDHTRTPPQRTLHKDRTGGDLLLFVPSSQ